MALARFRFEADGVLIEGEGVVTVTGAPTGDDREAIVAFLQSVDVESVEKEALQRQGWGDTSTLGKAIEILVEALTGRPA